jgi:biopolymer transport protein ExbB/TolQ
MKEKHECNNNLKERHNKNVTKKHGHIISSKEEHGCNRSVNKGHNNSSKEKKTHQTQEKEFETRNNETINQENKRMSSLSLCLGLVIPISFELGRCLGFEVTTFEIVVVSSCKPLFFPQT